MNKFIKITLLLGLFNCTVYAVNEENISFNKGKELYNKCISCHGQKGEKSGLNQSKIIKNMSKEEITSSLKGYQDGTYGGKMKGLMIGQTKNMTEDDILTLATYIKTLNAEKLK